MSLVVEADPELVRTAPGLSDDVRTDDRFRARWQTTGRTAPHELVAIAALGVASALAFATFLAWRVPADLAFDDWDPLVSRSISDVSGLFRPHADHLVVVPILVYRAVLAVFGVRALAYQVVSIGAHLVVSWLLWVVIRRAGVRPAIAAGFTILFMFLGVGFQNITYAFGMTFTMALGFGIAQLLLADHAGALDRRDVLGLCCGLLALGSSGVAVTMVVVVGVSMLLRRRWWAVVVHTVPLTVAYLVWWWSWPHETLTRAHFGEFVTFARLHLVGAIGGVLSPWSIAAALGCGVATVVVCRVRPSCSPTFDAPNSPINSLAMLVGAVVFLVTTGALRGGNWLVKTDLPASRYVYVIVALSLPAMAVGAEAIARRWRQATYAVVALCLASIPGNVQSLIDAQHKYNDGARFITDYVFGVARLPIARSLPPDTEVVPGITAGWLIAMLDQGKLPDSNVVGPETDATNTLSAALQRVATTKDDVTNCRPATAPLRITVQAHQRLTVANNPAHVTLRLNGVDSAPTLFDAAPFIGTTVDVLAGPLDLTVTPTSRGGSTTVCVDG